MRTQTVCPGADWDKFTGRSEETDGQNPEDSIGQDGSKGVKQDGTSLRSTSSTPKVRSTTASRRNSLRRHHEPGESATAGARRAERFRTLGIVILAVLMGLTSWAIAAISTWMVPVYVTAMVLIFVIPHGQTHGESEHASEPAGEITDQASEVTNPASPGPNSPGAKTLQVESSTEASAAGARSAGSSIPKRRRPRGQGRKSVKPGPEPAVATAPAAWIRIGPGKFVRADSQDQGHAAAPTPHATLEAVEASIEAEGSLPDLVDKTRPPDSSTTVDVPSLPEPDASGPCPEHETPSGEPVAIANPEPASPVVIPMLKADVAWPEVDSTTAPATVTVDGDSPDDPVVAEPVTEEYGIAPSAFGPSLLEASLEDEDHEQEWSDPPDSTSTGTETAVAAGQRNGNRCNWKQHLLRSSVPTVSGYGARHKMPRRHLQNVRSVRTRQDCAELGRAANYPARVMVRRSFGRSSKVYRGYQPRSPPARS